MDLKLILASEIILQFVFTEGKPEVDAVLRRLDVMEANLAKVDALLAGFAQLCQSINEINAQNIQKNDGRLCGENDKQFYNCGIEEKDHINGNNKVGEVDRVNGNGIVNTSNDREKTDMLEIVSVQSEGMTNDIVDVSVVYIADKTYVSEWFISLKKSTGTRSNGNVTERVTDTGRVEFTSRLVQKCVEPLNHLVLMINSPTYNAYLDINITRLSSKGKDLLKPIEYKVLDYSARINISDNDLKSMGFEESIRVSENVVEKVKGESFIIEASTDTFNWTSSPPSYINGWFRNTHDSDQDVFYIGVRNGSENELDIKMEKSLAQFGGIVRIRIIQNSENYHYLRGFSYGVQIKFVNNEIGDLLPGGSFGLYKYKEIEYVLGSSFSVFCMAYGVPVPKLRIFMKESDGKLEELGADYEVVFDPFVYKVIKDYPTRYPKHTGMHFVICEASHENTTLTEETTFMDLVRVEIDDKKTRLVKNTTEKVVIVCKAVGNPPPKLELRNGDEYGPDLLQDKRFDNRGFIGKKNVHKVTLVMSPRDENIRSVFCVAVQNVESNFFSGKPKKLGYLNLHLAWMSC